MATIKHLKKGVKHLISNLYFECYVTEICAMSAKPEDIRTIVKKISELNHFTKQQISTYRKQKPKGKACKKYFGDFKTNLAQGTKEIVAQLEKIETR